MAQDPAPLNPHVWTRRAPATGRVYPILLYGDFARGGMARRGLVLRPEGWSQAVAEGWIRAVRPLPRRLPAPPLHRVPAWARN